MRKISTPCKRGLKENGLQYLCIDDFYTLINGDERRHEDEMDVWLIFFKAIHLAELHGRDVIIDTNSPTYTKRTEFLDWFPSFEHHLVFIYAPFELCAKNNASRNREIPVKELRAIYESVESPNNDTEDRRWVSIQIIRNHDNTGYHSETMREVSR